MRPQIWDYNSVTPNLGPNLGVGWSNLHSNLTPNLRFGSSINGDDLNHRGHRIEPACMHYGYFDVQPLLMGVTIISSIFI